MKPPSKKPQQLSLASQEPSFNVKPTDQHRWPRQFTPDRLHEVADALPEGRFDVSMPHVARTPIKDMDGGFRRERRSRYAAVDSHFTTSRADGEMANKQVFRNRVVDIVSRSTTPTDDLSRLSFEATKLDPHTAGDYQNRQEYDKNYVPRPGVENNLASPDSKWAPAGKIRISTSNWAEGSQAESVVLHEIGHHADYLRDPAGFHRKSRDEGNPSPSLEGYAEGYMSQHHVARPGNQSPTRVYDARFGSVMNYLNERAIGSGGKVPHEAGRQPQRSTFDATSRQVAFQNANPLLFRRNISSFETQTQRDHGQWELETHEGEPMSKIRSGATEVPPLEQRLRPGVTPENYRYAERMRSSQSERLNDDQAIKVAKGAEVSEIRYGMPARIGSKDKKRGWK